MDDSAPLWTTSVNVGSQVKKHEEEEEEEEEILLSLVRVKTGDLISYDVISPVAYTS